MSRISYTRCPRCQRLNPTAENELGKEHTCVFCGAIIPPAKAGEAMGGVVASRRSYESGPKPRAESRPINRNKRKPMF